MGLLKIYLDNCTYNRPFDDQSYMKIRLETESKLYIQSGIREGKYLLVWSYMMDYENNDSPYDEKRNAVSLWKEIAVEHCPSSEDIVALGHRLMELGLKSKDSLHVACAITCGCDYFITTDKRLFSKTVPNIRIINPVEFVRETEE
jgi:hypothetical protein